MYQFLPPTFEENVLSDHRLFQRLKVTRSYSVLKINGEYYKMQYPSQDEIAEAEIFYQGGHTYYITDDEAADLTAAGYEVVAL